MGILKPPSPHSPSVPSAPELVVVMPVFNEEGAVRDVIEEWMACIPLLVSNFVLLIIDDGSTDGTLLQLEQARAVHGHGIEILSRANRGHGRSCVEGYRIAAEKGAAWVLQIDSDGQCDPRFFSALWEKRKNADAIYGVRAKRDDGLIRMAISWVLKLFLLMMGGAYCKDPNTPYRLMRTSVLGPHLENADAVNLSNICLALHLRKDRSVRHASIPIRFRKRTAGVSKTKPMDFIRKAFELGEQLRAAETPLRVPASTFLCEPGKIPRWLVYATLVFLALPLVLFLVAWLKWGWAALGLAGVVGAAWTLVRAQGPGGGTAASSGLSGIARIALLVVPLVIFGFNGPGGFGLQTWDWGKHNAILLDLVEKDWPVIYATTADPAALVYYVAYYLPAGAVGKWFGWEAANIALYLWTCVGGMLVLRWMLVLTGAAWWLVVLVWMFFSGMDLVGAFAVCPATEPFRWVNDFNAEWWSRFWTLPSNMTLIAYAPHQALPGWLCTAMMLGLFRMPPGMLPIGALLVLSVLWSPLVSIGLLFLAGLWWLTRVKSWRLFFIRAVRLELVAVLVLGMLLAVYFGTRLVPFELPHNLRSPKKLVEMGGFYLTLKQAPVLDFAGMYVSAVVIEFGLVAFLLWRLLPPTNRRARGILIAAAALLAILPWFHYGAYNDLVMRVCIPPLFAIQILVLAVLANDAASRRRPMARNALILVLCLSALYPINMLRLTVWGLHQRSWHVVTIPAKEHTPDLFRQQRDLKKLLFFIGQYTGSVHAFFFEHLAKRNVPPADELQPAGTRRPGRP